MANAYMSQFSSHTTDQMLCGHFHLAWSPDKHILSFDMVYLIRCDAMLHRPVDFGLLGVLAEQVGVCLLRVL